MLPELKKVGKSDDQIVEQRYFTDGRIVTTGEGHFRKPGKKADYILRYRPDFTIAVIEAKVAFKKPGDGLQQAMDYAEILGLKFAERARLPPVFDEKADFVDVVSYLCNVFLFVFE